MIIDSFTPESGTNNGKAIITLKGTGFTSDSITNVWLDNATLGRIFYSGRDIINDSHLNVTFDLSGQTPGSYIIVLNTVSGKYFSSTPFRIFYPHSPVIANITPESGWISDPPFTCIVNGSYFIPGSLLEFINSGGKIYSVPTIFRDSTQLSCTFSPGAERGDWYSVRVLNPDGQFSTEEVIFTVFDLPPSLMTVAPAIGFTSDSSFELSISGKGFQQGCSVEIRNSTRHITLRNLSETSVSQDGSEIISRFDLTGMIPGIYQVFVENPDGQVSTDDVSVIIEYPPPIVSTIQPSSHSVGEKNGAFIVTGSEFQSGCVVSLVDSNGNDVARGTDWIVSGDGKTIQGNFDFSNPGLGYYLVSVRNPDGKPSNEQVFLSLTPVPKKKFQILVASNPGGLTNPQGIITVDEGSGLGITISPNPGYMALNLYDDGIPHGALTSYILNDICSNHEIFVEFLEISPEPEPTGTVLPTPSRNYSILASADSGSTVFPSGLISIQEGTDLSLSMNALSRYHLNDTIIDNVTKGPVSSWVFENIHENHTLTVHSNRNNSPVWADFQVSGNMGNAPLIVTIQSSVFLDATHEFWDFGDGCTAYGKPSEHLYVKPGVYSIEHHVVFPQFSCRYRKEDIIRVN